MGILRQSRIVMSRALSFSLPRDCQILAQGSEPGLGVPKLVDLAIHSEQVGGQA